VVVGATAVLALVGVATYTASLDRLSTTPRDQGVTWDVTIGNPNLSQYTTDDVARLVADPRVAGVMPVAAPQSRGAVNGTAVTVAGVDVTGAVAPPVIEGRLPTHAGEVALGRRTAEQLHARVGDTVALAFDGPSTQLTVVGTALLNPGLAPTMQIGDGALITLDQLQTMQPDSPVTFLLARMRPGVDIDRAITDLSATWGPNVARPPEAPDIVNLDRVRSIPVALALALGGGAAVLLGFTLVMSVTNRRRDLGVLRAVGATRRQLRSVLVWQAVWLYLAAVLIGIPAGITVGRLAWRRIDDDLGAGVAPVIPAGRLLVVVAVGLALALVLAYLPSRLVLRDRPARSLRSE
jgi:putative ABC transport system permease protein